MNHSADKPPAEWMEHLHHAGQWARLEQVARDTLAVDPGDVAGHFHLGWALLKQDRALEMEHHVRFLLDLDSESVEVLQLAALWQMASGRPKKARIFIQTALQIVPDDAMLWFLSSSAECQSGNLKEGLRHAAKARELDPDNADIAHLHISLTGVEKTGTSESFKQLQELEAALALDPENDNILASIAEIHLDRLEQPGTAEQFYRRALRIAPTDKDHQRGLLKAMQARRLWHRTLCLPAAGWELAVNVMRGLKIKPYLALFLLLGWKFVLFFLAWLTVSFLVMGPAAWCVEWLVLSEMSASNRLAAPGGGWISRFHERPRGQRMTACLVLLCLCWWGVFTIFGVTAAAGFSFICAVYLMNFSFLSLKVFICRFAAWRHARKGKKPPPLPKPPPANGPPPLPI